MPIDVDVDTSINQIDVSIDQQISDIDVAVTPQSIQIDLNVETDETNIDVFVDVVAPVISVEVDLEQSSLDVLVDVVSPEIDVEVTIGSIQGPKGDDGLSAYELWINQGNIGSQQDYIDSLKGDKGDQGDAGASTEGNDGLSAYDIWLNDGNTGTEQDFLDSLIGKRGPAGPTAVSTDEGNSASLGDDGLVFVPPQVPDSASVDLNWLYLGVSGNLDPNPNYYKMNNADPALITELYMSTTSYPNRAVGNILGILNDGDRLYLQQRSSQDKFINANIMGAPVDNGSYYTISVEVFNSDQPFDINQFCDLIVYHVSGGDNPPSQGLRNPVFTYNMDELQSIDYDNGANKTLQYDSNGVLEFLFFTTGNVTTTKEFIYNAEGQLTSVLET